MYIHLPFVISYKCYNSDYPQLNNKYSNGVFTSFFGSSLYRRRQMCSNIGTATSLLTGLRETSGARIHCHRWIWAALISSTKNNQVNPQQREQNRLTLYVIFSNTHDSKKLINWPCEWFFMTQKKLSIFCTFHLIFRKWNNSFSGEKLHYKIVCKF